MNLKTSKERVKMLKRGFTGTEIENKYIELNEITVLKNNTRKK
jgi:hypothetical protein